MKEFRHFEDWEERAGVRKATQRDEGDIDWEDGLLFSPDLVSVLAHPIMVKQDVTKKRWVLAQTLYSSLGFTQVLEHAVINDAVFKIARRESGFDLPAELQVDAWKILVDESFHGKLVFDLEKKVEWGTKITNTTSGPPAFYTKLRRIQAEADPEIRDILSLFFCAVSETLITRTLLDIPRDDRVVEPVRRVMREHAEDESRHHRFFADFLTRAWPQLTLRQRQKIGPLIPRFVSIFIDADPINTERILTEVGLTRLDASQVVTETFTRESIINARLQSSKACLMTLSRAGVLGDTHVQDALGMYGFSAEEQLAEFEG